MSQVVAGEGVAALPSATLCGSAPGGAPPGSAPGALPPARVRPPPRGACAKEKTPRQERLRESSGGWGGSRTPDTGIFSPLLYQLSYPAVCVSD